MRMSNVTHFALLRNQNTGVTYNARNFTMCFDKTKVSPPGGWLSAPQRLHGFGACRNLAYDPKIAAEYQPT